MEKPGLAELQDVIRHRFKEPALLERAVTHRSVVAPAVGSGSGSGNTQHAAGHNEQLEYLGDSVLGMIVSEHLVRTFPAWAEGQLSKSRSRLVNAVSLCSAARRLGLGAHLRLGRGEEKTGGRDKPALLGDAFEAIVAAIYLDGGLEAARAFVARALLDTAIEAQGDDLQRSDQKSALQELLQKRGLPPAKYDVVNEAGPDHEKRFCVSVHIPGLVSATGEGSSKKQAEGAAAAEALAQLMSERAKV